ncbi:Sec-independent protein translocase subunit TatA/TatB [Haloferula rosea]|uniref:Sec-independent protein translocase protein TatA n=1 Tax=Haloferula rosea TaxID=490093 RepID=A0A934VDB0_9BACT|nr:twin-arginine translocase TatA/TatE family subunit [Haloferula rosea]MBK1826099.1 twin-arginine translocase TatA/TatE family subunit [Haloferula rosea]
MNSPLAFGLPQGPEWIIIFVVVLLLFGAKKIPELARGLGKSMGEFKKAREDFEREIKSAEADASREEDEVKVKEVAGKEPREI